MADTRNAAPLRADGFDQDARDRIRRSLLGYMTQHRIGVPTLRNRIAIANGVEIDDVDQKTLQRFLANTHRSRDEFVGYCHAFVEMQPEDEPVEALGEQLTAFLGVGREGQDCRPVPPEWAGSYRVLVRRIPEPGKLRLHMGAAGDWVDSADVLIELPPRRTFATIRETIDNWTGRPADASQFGTETVPRRAYEGVLIYPNGALFVVMRNILSGAPRTYWLAPTAGGRLGGYGHEARTILDDTLGGLLHVSDVRFARHEAQEA